MTALAIISAAIALAFVLTAIARIHEVPDSISALVYTCRWRWSWTMWLWAVALTLAAPLIESLHERHAYAGFLTAASLLMVGAMPLSGTDSRTVHNAVGVLAGVLSQLCVLLLSPLWLLWWSLMAAAFVAWHDDTRIPMLAGKAVFLAEAVCALSLYGSLLTVVFTKHYSL